MRGKVVWNRYSSNDFDCYEQYRCAVYIWLLCSQDKQIKSCIMKQNKKYMITTFDRTEEHCAPCGSPSHPERQVVISIPVVVVVYLHILTQSRLCTWFCPSLDAPSSCGKARSRKTTCSLFMRVGEFNRKRKGQLAMRNLEACKHSWDYLLFGTSRRTWFTGIDDLNWLF